MNRKNQFNDYQNLRFTVTYVLFQQCDCAVLSQNGSSKKSA